MKNVRDFDPAYVEHKLLDHGYLRLVDAWGSDQSIVEAARMSTDKGFLGWGPVRFCPEHSDEVSKAPGYPSGGSPQWACPQCGKWTERPGDEKLLAYLWKNKHSTPFEMAGLTIEVQAPIFVFREWHRHRVPFGYSELSARYSPMPDLNYLPTVERCLMGGGHLTKQAAGADFSQPLTDATAEAWLIQLEDLYEHSQLVYETGLKVGIPKELARLAVTVARFSRMRATGNLRGWLAFLALRNAPTAQYEIRVFAQVVARLLSEKFPRTMQVVGELVAP